MTNRLIHATSPYLLQHARNPVDWNPWDAESLERARREDKPIFLSIGYSACHWCHVMERESFEDPAVAAELNAHFIPVKVDREERPDLDDLYMGAVQAISGRGGWPMSVWLTPELKPFYGGTYYPPAPRYGMPGFLPLLRSIRAAWAAQRAGLEEDAASLVEAMARQDGPGADLPGPGPVRRALDQLERSFDPAWGGFGPAPKFPQPCVLELLLRGSRGDRGRALRTLDAMAEGGIHDHLGGGFARYSVDAQWLVPHFEKMLYDNAQLASVYLEAFQITGEPRYAAVARATLDYLLRDLRDPAGGFHSSEDADSEGEEGRFYVFTPREVEAVLGEADGGRFCRAYGITEAGCFEHGTSVLHRSGAAGPEVEDGLRERLRAHRDRRVRPAKDDKVLAAWNGLALSALAKGAQILGEARYLEAAGALAAFLRRELWREGALLRTWRQGAAHTEAFLEDYAAVAQGLVDLFEAGFEARWLRWAFELGERLRDRFEDPGLGFYTSSARADLLLRQKPFQDGAMPSGNTLAARALLALGRHFGHAPFLEAAEGVLRCASPLLERHPAACPGLLAVLASTLAPGPELVIAGDPGAPLTRALVAQAHRAHRPGGVLSLVEADPALPLHRDRSTPEPCAFLCRAGTCAPPLRDPEALAAALASALDHK